MRSCLAAIETEERKREFDKKEKDLQEKEERLKQKAREIKNATIDCRVLICTEYVKKNEKGE